MSIPLKLSDIRKWTGIDDFCFDSARAVVSKAQKCGCPLDLVPSKYLQTILQNAPCECVEMYTGGDKWLGPHRPGQRPGGMTYRLHPDVQVVDDTGDGYEYVECKQFWAPNTGRYGWWLGKDGPRLTNAHGLVGHVCQEVTDAENEALRQAGKPFEVWYVACWQGAYACYGIMYRSVEDFLSGKALEDKHYSKKTS